MVTIIINNNSSILKTDNKKLLTTLEKKYSAKVPGYNYSAAKKSSSLLKPGSLVQVFYLI